jgi:hypothetical protein
MIRPGSCYHDREREDPDMGTARKYAVIDPATGKIDRIFSDQAVYDDEMEKISGTRAWCPRQTISSTPTWAKTRSS